MSGSFRHSIRLLGVIFVLAAVPSLLMQPSPAGSPYASGLSVVSIGVAFAAPSNCANTICGALGLHHCDKNRGTYCHKSLKDPTRCGTSLCL